MRHHHCGLFGSTSRIRVARRLGVALALGVAAFWSHALEPQWPSPLVLEPAFAPSSTPPSAALPGERGQPRLELSGGSLPRFDGAEGVTREQRIDLSWLAPTPSALGPSIGLTGIGSQPQAAGLASGGPGQPPVQPLAVNLGLHWRHTLDSDHRVDVMAWRRLPQPQDAISQIQSREPQYGARVEMKLSPVRRTGLVAARGFIGFQLESGARITLRRNGGKPMLYYRNKF